MSMQCCRATEARTNVFRLLVQAAILMAFCLMAAETAVAQAKAPARPAAKVAKPSASEGPAASDLAKDAKIGQDWVRMQYDANGEVLGMQTAIVRYTGKGPSGKPVQVDLI